MKDKIFGVIGILLLVVGISFLYMSTTYERYTNKEEYQSKYMQLKDGENRTLQFYELRSEYLTPKFELEDYGFTLSLLSIPFVLISIRGIGKMRTLNKKSWISAIGIFAALLTCSGYVCELFFEMGRDSYPYWADSLAIPLGGAPILLIVSLTWVALNLIGLNGDFKTGVLIFPLKFDNLNYWYLTILILTTVVLALEIIAGNFWQILSGFLWIYFYLNILTGLRQARIERIN